MGYDTTYELLIVSGNDDGGATTTLHTWKDRLFQVVKNDPNCHDCKYNPLDDANKWWDEFCDTHMLVLSEMYPEATFMLKGWGDDPEDVWATYYHNGQIQRDNVITTYRKFDPKKLTKCVEYEKYKSRREKRDDMESASDSDSD